MGQSDATVKARMRCREIMAKTVKTVPPNASIADVAAIMRDGDIGAVPIVKHGELVGIVTDRDIVIKGVAKRVSSDLTIDKVMTSELFTVGPEDFVFEAVRLMGDKQVR